MYDAKDELHPYNVHLYIEERRIWKKMLDARGVDEELYEDLKQEWFGVVDRQMLNIEAHEGREYIESMWANSRNSEEAIIKASTRKYDEDTDTNTNK